METATVYVYHQEIGLTDWAYTYYRTEGNVEDRHADIYYRGKCVGERRPDCINRFDLLDYYSLIEWHIVKSIRDFEEGLEKSEKYTYVKF